MKINKILVIHTLSELVRCICLLCENIQIKYNLSTCFIFSTPSCVEKCLFIFEYILKPRIRATSWIVPTITYAKCFRASPFSQAVPDALLYFAATPTDVTTTAAICYLPMAVYSGASLTPYRCRRTTSAIIVILSQVPASCMSVFASEHMGASIATSVAADVSGSVSASKTKKRRRPCPDVWHASVHILYFSYINHVQNVFRFPSRHPSLSFHRWSSSSLSLMSLSMPSLHLRLGLPLFLRPCGGYWRIRLGNMLLAFVACEQTTEAVLLLYHAQWTCILEFAGS